MDALSIDPARTALLNVDMQNCFVEGSPVSAPGGRALLDRINELTKACRTAGVLVVHARHVLRPDGSNAGLLAEIPPVAAGMINKGSTSAEFHSSLIIDDGDIVLLLPDGGWKYLSTQAWAPDLEMAEKQVEARRALIGEA